MESKYYFIVTDIHGYFDELKESLELANYDITNPNHIFVSLGDLLDRGGKPRQCLKFVNSIPDSRKILIRGNHEDLLEEAVKRGEFLEHDYHNKTPLTLLCMNANLHAILQDPDYKPYKKALRDYYEDEHCIFVHGWIPCDNKWGVYFYYNPDWRTGDWNKARWINGMSAWNYGVKEEGKTIFCGHWHCSWGHQYLRSGSKDNFFPFIDEGIVALDTCTAYTHKVNCVVVEKESGKLVSINGHDI